MAFEKLGGAAYILSIIVFGICVLCEIAFGAGYYDGTITIDQFLLYSVCAVILMKIMHVDQKAYEEQKVERERTSEKVIY